MNVLRVVALPFLALGFVGLFLLRVLMKLKEVSEHAVGALVLVIASYFVLFPSQPTADAIRNVEIGLAFFVALGAVISSVRRRFADEDGGNTVWVRLGVAGVVALIGLAAPDPSNILLRVTACTLGLWMSVRPLISVVLELREVV